MIRQHGYFLGKGYTYGVYPETFPNQLTLVSLLSGHRPPARSGAFTMLDFGCGQGLNLCLQACLHPEARFYGIDLSSDHIAHANELAAAAGLDNVTVLQADLLDLADSRMPPALAAVWGQCQIAMAHGVLGWVSPEVGQALTQAAAAALAPGGLLYLSYNTMPGWLAALPFQHAVMAMERRGGNSGKGVDQAREPFDQLQQCNALVFNSLPDLTGRLQGLGKRQQSYLLHEYAHEQWQPLCCDRVIEACSNHGLTFLGSADLPEIFTGLLPSTHQQLIRQQSDPAMKQLVRDLLVNQPFRRDVYAHGKVLLWAGEAEQALGAIRLRSRITAEALEQPDATLLTLDDGETRLPAEICRPLLLHLLQGPASIADLKLISASTISLQEFLSVVCLLLHARKLEMVMAAPDPLPAQRLNTLLLERVAAGAPYRWLACPALGSVERFDRLSLVAMHAVTQGHRGYGLSQAMVQAMARLKLRLSEDNGDSAGTPSAGLTRWLEAFEQQTLPALQNLGVLPQAC